MGKNDLKRLVRQNIWNLKPYSSARDEHAGYEGVLLDANENPFGKKNRYPDPHLRELKARLSSVREIPTKNILIGNGSDEIIDLVFRIFCEPAKDNVILCPPTYGMYEVSANINNINIINVQLDNDFQLNINKILKQNAKCIFVCSPNNPTGNILHDVEILLNKFKGIVVIDEAYIDFSDSPSFLSKLSKYPNLIIMQTFSKAWALASARVGVAYASEDIIKLMDKTKPPYNVSKFNQEEALKAISNLDKLKEKLTIIKEQRGKLQIELSKLPIVKHIFPSDANFILVEMHNADKTHSYLLSENVIVRNRNSIVNNCLRISVGTPDENKKLIDALKKLAVIDSTELY